VKKGDKVKITFQNSVGNHDFVLDAFNIKTAVLGSGKSETVEFTADKTGQFEYYCSVGNHRQMGMTGTLVVQ
jgi:plastocyanin